MEGKIKYKFGMIKRKEKNVFLKNNKNTLYTTDKHKYNRTPPMVKAAATD